MRKESVIRDYTIWLRSLVGDDVFQSGYGRLFEYLQDREFVYKMRMDINRAVDGINLRRRFVYEHKYPELIRISDIEDGRPCSVLEMMVGLSVRCEETIMFDPDIGDRTGKWFWEMVDSLGLSGMTDDHFDESQANRIINRFLDRDYGPDGEGGLFTMRNCRHDLRKVEIWYQAMWYLDDYILHERSM